MLLKTLQPMSPHNVMVRDLDLLKLHQVDARRLEVGCCWSVPLPWRPDRAGYDVGRWSAPLPWRPDRAGYDVGLTLETGRDATHSLCRGRRCDINTSPPSESERTLNSRVPTLQSPVGRAGLRGGRQLVFRNANIPPAACQGQDSPCSSRSSYQRQVGLVVEAELNSGLCQCPRLRTVSVGRTCHSLARVAPPRRLMK